MTECFFAPQPAPTCAAAASSASSGSAALGCLLERVVLRTAALVAAWQSVGFAHGVMNTDNLAAVGVTIDLNVWGFVASAGAEADAFAPNFIDSESRYAFACRIQTKRTPTMQSHQLMFGFPRK